MIGETKNMAIEIGKIADAKKGQDIVILDIRQISSFADYFVIASGTSTRHVKAIADEIEDQMKDKGFELNHKEGYDSGTWILMDYNTVIVHIFIEEQRSFYSIERVWRDATQLGIDI
ncbi:ribosome silencing factor [Geosporobacter ferrireducens]|uniref:Ribosomal silencing factor RsfS n=1 Tax=Geosporobacter ferrireducens TaxID=1424294 RepID=A0A1D8GPH6_9FIRM|nr:ribosome silencing factor [Geosporobacter ferrireducens]AOT72777.1 ribosome silencing factor [Geosporobacter ferrireducens]MTI55193.1 ribosome silencing factor [Geosporobacter ferrireducens]